MKGTGVGHLTIGRTRMLGSISLAMHMDEELVAMGQPLTTSVDMAIAPK